MKKIGIIGGGFAGTMVAVQVIEKTDVSCEIIIIDENKTISKGIAYNPYSDRHLLNVITSKMSAFPDDANHFFNWVMLRNEYRDSDEMVISNSFLPRKLYGEYLEEIWKSTLQRANKKGILVTHINGNVVDLNEGTQVDLKLENGTTVTVDYCVIATGNQVPRNPKIKNAGFYDSKKYFQNPWMIESVLNLNEDHPVLIVGNGLTMVDTVMGLTEHGFKGEIYSISPNGFKILPHRHNGLKYSKLTEELDIKLTLKELFKLVKKHIKEVRKYGVSAEPVIDSLRPYSQQIWKNLSDDDKALFMSRLRHLWGVARHRIPMHIYDKIQQLQVEGRLHVNSGKIIDFMESGESITVEYHDKKCNEKRVLNVSRIINCTGPETDLMKLENGFLKNCMLKGIITQDKMKLGIVADTETFQIVNSRSVAHQNLFTLGSNLKGELWESTAVNEIRVQADQLAKRLVGELKNEEKLLLQAE